jgi:hypothetical protein
MQPILGVDGSLVAACGRGNPACGNYPLYAEILSVLLSIGNNPHEISFTYQGTPKIPINAGE